MSRILINDIRSYAYHGCLSEEAIIGGHYRVDAILTTDFSEAAEKDDLSKTVDYCDVQRIVQREMELRSKLIEHVAKRIGDALMLELPSITHLRLTVTKLSPPMGGDVKSVAVELDFTR